MFEKPVFRISLTCVALIVQHTDVGKPAKIQISYREKQKLLSISEIFPPQASNIFSYNPSFR